MQKIPNIKCYYPAINLLKKFRHEKLEIMRYDDIPLYGKRKDLEVLVYDIKTASQILSLRLYNKNGRLVQNELIKLSSNEAHLLLLMFERLDHMSKK